MNIIKDWFTSRNGVDWSMSKMLASVTGGVMLYKFIVTATPDYTGFGIAIGAIIAALAVKNATDEPQK